MGNRAIIKPVDKNIGVYLHWNGGRDSVEPFLNYCKLRGFRDFGGKDADGYGIARFMQVVGNFFGGSLSLGLETGVEMTDEQAEWLDNGIYEVDGWKIVGRCPADIEEQNDYDMIDMLISIDQAQPKNERLGSGFIRGIQMPAAQLKPGDVIWFYDEMTYGDKPKCRRHKITGIEKKDGVHKGKPYFMERSIFDKKQYRRYLSDAAIYRLDTTSRKEMAASE